MFTKLFIYLRDLDHESSEALTVFVVGVVLTVMLAFAIVGIADHVIKPIFN